MTDKQFFSIFVLKNCFTQFTGTNYPRELIPLIMKSVIDACFVLEIKKSQTDVFKNIFSMMNDLIKHCCIKVIREKGLYLSVLTPNRGKLITFNLTNFDTCYCEKSEFFMGIKVKEFNKQLNLLDSSHSIILYICNDASSILRIYSGSKEIKYSLRDEYMGPTIPEEKLTFAYSFSIPEEKLTFTFSFSMTYGEFNTLYDKLNNVSKFFTIDSNGIQSCDRYSINQSTFKLKSLSVLRKYKELCSNIIIKGKENFMLGIQMQVGSVGNLCLYITPEEPIY